MLRGGDMISYKNKSFCSFKELTDTFAPKCEDSVKSEFLGKFYSKIRSRLTRLGTLIDNAIEDDFDFVFDDRNYEKANGQPIYVKGQRFTSVVDACRALKPDDVDYDTFYTTVLKRLERLGEKATPETISKAFSEPLKRIIATLTVCGVEYRSFAKACEAYGIKRQAALKQFRKTDPQTQTEIDIFFKERGQLESE